MQVILTILRNIRPEFDFISSSNFLADGILDSFDLINLVAALEKFYGISINGMDIIPENFENMSAIEGLLKKYGISG